MRAGHKCVAVHLTKRVSGANLEVMFAHFCFYTSRRGLCRADLIALERVARAGAYG